ncbi:MAG: 2-phosphosulfolactate phosphatase [Bacteroidota bacterium]
MHLDVIFLPAAIGNLSGRTGVVIDVLRATTTIITALGHGCPEVLPVELPEEAIELARKFGRDSHLVGGERKGFKVEGFDLGNSPLEYDAGTLSGRKVILCTTNGTGAIRRAAAAQARPLLLAAMVNAPSVAKALLSAGNDATLICAGRGDAFAMEDALCAGAMAAEILGEQGWSGTDSAHAAAALWERYGRANLAASLAATEHGAYLASIGFADDVAAASEVGTTTLIPVYREGCVVKLEVGS